MKLKKRRMEVLAGLVNQHGWTSGAEIGVWRGATFFYLLDHCPRLRLIGVDSWQAPAEPHDKDTDLGLSTWYPPVQVAAWAESVKAKALRYPNALIYHEDSLAAAAHVPDGNLDFVFVDAEHTTEAVLADVTAWRPKVRPGGWVLGHDEEWGSVQRALKQLFPQWTKFDDNVWGVAT